MPHNVLLVEDDPALRMVMREAMSGEFEIEEADNGADGIQMGLSSQADVVILDYHLPKKDGLEVIEALRKERPDVPVIVLTGYLNAASEARFNELGANKIFAKPFNYKTLIDTVKSLVEPKAATSAHKAPAYVAAPISLAGTGLSPTRSEALEESLEALANVAEKIEFMQTITQKYWIDSDDIAALRETASCMESALRQFYGKMNNTLFTQGDAAVPILQNASKPCVVGNN